MAGFPGKAGGGIRDGFRVRRGKNGEKDSDEASASKVIGKEEKGRDADAVNWNKDAPGGVAYFEEKKARRTQFPKSGPPLGATWRRSPFESRTGAASRGDRRRKNRRPQSRFKGGI